MPEAGILAHDVNNPRISIANRSALAQAKHDIRVVCESGTAVDITDAALCHIAPKRIVPQAFENQYLAALLAPLQCARTGLQWEAIQE